MARRQVVAPDSTRAHVPVSDHQPPRLALASAPVLFAHCARPVGEGSDRQAAQGVPRDSGRAVLLRDGHAGALFKSCARPVLPAAEAGSRVAYHAALPRPGDQLLIS